MKEHPTYETPTGVGVAIHQQEESIYDPDMAEMRNIYAHYCAHMRAGGEGSEIRMPADFRNRWRKDMHFRRQWLKIIASAARRTPEFQKKLDKSREQIDGMYLSLRKNVESALMGEEDVPSVAAA